MSLAGAHRVRYFDGQHLDAGDLETEQSYHLDARRRHALSQHGWGITQGLNLAVRDGRITIGAGQAIDGYGRSLVLPLGQSLAIDNEEQQRLGHHAMSLWLEYAVTERAGDPSRLDEVPVLRSLFHEKAAAIVPAALPGTTLYRRCAPWQDLPLDPAARWPLLLGTVIFGGPSPDYPMVETSGRRYGGLRAGWLQSPDGAVRLDLGAGDPASAALSITFPPDAPATADQAAEPPALTLAGDGTLTLPQSATIGRSVIIADGALEFLEATEQDGEAPGWRLYRHRDPKTGEEELRIEIAAGSAQDPKAEPKNAFVVGAQGPDGKTFLPGLTVREDSQVTVHGDLYVAGRIHPSAQSPAAPELTPEAAQVLKSNALAAQTGAMAQAKAAPPPKNLVGKLLQALKAVGPKIKKLLTVLLAVAALASSYLGGVASQTKKPFVTVAEEEGMGLLQKFWPGAATEGTTKGTSTTESAGSETKPASTDSDKATTDSKSGEDPSSQDKTEAKPEKDPPSESKPEAKPEADTSSQSKTDAKPEADASSQGKTETKPEKDPTGQSKTEAKPKADTPSQSKTEAKPEKDPPSQSKPDAKPEADTSSQSKPEAKPEADAPSESKPEAKPKEAPPSQGKTGAASGS